MVHPMASIGYQGGANEECDDPIFMILSNLFTHGFGGVKRGVPFLVFSFFFTPAQCHFPADLKSLRTAIELLLPWSHSIACRRITNYCDCSPRIHSQKLFYSPSNDSQLSRLTEIFVAEVLMSACRRQLHLNML